VTPFAGINTDRLLIQAMKTAEMNHRVLAQNIANVDTPNYNPVNLDFKKVLSAAIEGRGGIALRTSRPRHLDFTDPRPNFKSLAFLSKNDYNKVDLDEQMAQLSENTGKYTTYAALLTKRFEMTKNMLSSLAR
jgi:flagellar basal-body rod protein FlgB